MNPPNPDKELQYSNLIQNLLASADGLVSTDEMVTRILERRSTSAKNPRLAVLAKLREQNGRQLIYLDKTHVLPLRLAFQGARYRLHRPGKVSLKLHCRSVTAFPTICQLP